MDIARGFRESELGRKMLRKVRERAEGLGRRVTLMEVCGTHTVAISRSGIRALLSEWVDLRSGPGCPVCVTDVCEIDEAIGLCRIPGVTVATYGDMVRVPGSRSSLAGEMASGADVRVMYSALDVPELAESLPQKEVVFLGVGFETTVPGAALMLEEAQRRGVKNLSILSLHKLTPPAVKALLADPEIRIDGFICPGHVSTVIGSDAWSFISNEYGRPAVVCGFEPLDIIRGVDILLEQLSEGKAETVNAYPRAVRSAGNPTAWKKTESFFEKSDGLWRGIGIIPESGLRVRKDFSHFDAASRFDVKCEEVESARVDGCRCGEVLKGKIVPFECPLFDTACTPLNPIGPCMVSTEGACAAYYRYDRKHRDD